MTAVEDTTRAAPLEPGVHRGVPDDVYHADPALSSTGARRLLPPSCPAKFRYEQDHSRPPKKVFDFGHVAHTLVLGRGETIEVVDAGDWRTKAAKEQRDEARKQGKVPILAHDYETCEEMAAAIRAHDVAAALLNPEHGEPEVTIVWDDPATGVRCRARLDWLPDPTGRRMIFPDYKTCPSAAPDDITRAVANFSYHQQEDWYTDAVQQVGLGGDDTAMVFIFQEKTPPYIVTVCELDHDTKRSGRIRNDWARQTYMWCTERDQWPPYQPDIALISLPPWAQEQE